jgi:hypothetical protein
MKRRIVCVLAAATLIVATPRDALAWSRDGHRIVCRIAWRLLEAPHRAEINRLTNAYRDPDGKAIASFWDACSYADDVRGRARGGSGWRRFAVFETWHYANVPRTTTRLSTPPCQEACVITAVQVHTDSLRHAPQGSRTEALFLLSHWIGDLHQPLHLSFADDRGGNDVRPIEGGYYSAPNMHALWDSEILRKLLGNARWEDFADSLADSSSPAQRSRWIEGGAADWAQESYDIVTSPSAQYCDWEVIGGAPTCNARPGRRVLNESYQREFKDVVAQRLQLAGVRLAQLLRTHLALPQ